MFLDISDENYKKLRERDLLLHESCRDIMNGLTKYTIISTNERIARPMTLFSVDDDYVIEHESPLDNILDLYFNGNFISSSDEEQTRKLATHIMDGLIEKLIQHEIHATRCKSYEMPVETKRLLKTYKVAYPRVYECDWNNITNYVFYNLVNRKIFSKYDDVYILITDDPKYHVGVYDVIIVTLFISTIKNSNTVIENNINPWM